MTWFLRNWDQVLLGLYEHIVISASALVISFVIAFGVGLWAARREAVYQAALAVSGFLYTIPTLAFLALLIPIVGLGKTNAILVMVCFSLLILIRNIATGIRGAPAEVVDAAVGMGMSGTQVLWRVEIPLALPVIVAGLRIAAVTVISVSVVAAYVGAGGLGTLIFNGISNDHAPKIWAGALTACALAVAVDLSLAMVERRLLRRTRG